VRPLYRTGIAFSVPPHFGRIPTLVATELLPLIGSLGQRSQTIQAPPVASKAEPTFQVAIEVLILPPPRVLAGA
jgi:hypothetical protein